MKDEAVCVDSDDMVAADGRVVSALEAARDED